MGQQREKENDDQECCLMLCHKVKKKDCNHNLNSINWIHYLAISVDEKAHVEM